MSNGEKIGRVIESARVSFVKPEKRTEEYRNRIKYGPEPHTIQYMVIESLFAGMGRTPVRVHGSALAAPEAGEEAREPEVLPHYDLYALPPIEDREEAARLGQALNALLARAEEDFFAYENAPQMNKFVPFDPNASS
jgi:hypothetical protein